MKKPKHRRNKKKSIINSIYPTEKPYKNTKELLDLAERTNHVEIVTPEQRNFYIKSQITYKKRLIIEPFFNA